MVDPKMRSVEKRVEVSYSWEEVASSPAFRRLIEGKKRFLVPAVVFFLLYYFLLPSFAGWAKSLMAVKVSGAINFGYVFALSQFVMVWGLAWLYVRKANHFDRMAEEVAQEVKGGGE
ncbi:DUF485 domain-containing protein [Kyrpidia spormannii]|uniref:DUF485 domain-containing protein n=1 Tax=Kyrpidia spormannii TaxID=2055160 RepID=A0A2K8N4E3_9BACL|nr:DUF485 domain-containing protein [Kyrpidia spormannii]ATY84274.1 DUF485 domain-containing protein [Kyrpidia spormannii]